MHTVISFLSLFSFPFMPWKFCNKIPISAYEKNEKRAKSQERNSRLFSVNSLYSFISFLRTLNDTMALVPQQPVAKWHSQPTRCGHTLTRCPLPGLASGCAPSTPAPRTAYCLHVASGVTVRFCHVPRSTLLRARLAFLACKQNSTLGQTGSKLHE